MSTKKSNDPKFVACIQYDYYHASLDKIYQFQTDENEMIDSDIRIIDESEEDYLFPADYFISIQLPKDIENAMLHLY